jgi:hypothetical protein
VFVPDRATTVQLARVLAGRLTAASTAAVVEELRQQEEIQSEIVDA